MLRSALVRVLLTAVLVAGCSAAAESGTPGRSVTTEPPSATPGAPSPSASDASPTAGLPVAPSPSATPVPPAAWGRLRPERSPASREDHTWTVDPAARQAYLFGGRDGNKVRGDLWVFDLARDTWQRLRPDGDGPQARFGHEAVWVDGIGLVVWAGQAGPTTFFDDLWAYDPAAARWSRLPNRGDRPVGRYGSCSALGPDGRLWISHGFTEDGTRFADTRAYDFAAGSWSDETPLGAVPVNRCLHGCWWTDDGRFALYAGQTTGVQALDDLWTLGDPGGGSAAWTRVDGELPKERNLYAFARHGDAIVVFGGRGLGKAYREDAFTIDLASSAILRLRPEGTGPSGRSGAALIDDPAGGRVVLFGGRTARGALADTWELRLP